jgi:hypothetical protein
MDMESGINMLSLFLTDAAAAQNCAILPMRTRIVTTDQQALRKARIAIVIVTPMVPFLR